MMRGITAVRAVVTAFVRITLVVAFLAGSMAQQGSAQAGGQWYRFSTAVNHNGDDNTSTTNPKYFAEVLLRIELTQDQRRLVDQYAAAGTAASLRSLKDLLKQALKGHPDSAANKANSAIIEALQFKRLPGILMGIDWVNIGTGIDYSGAPRASAFHVDAYVFADIHLLIPLDQQTKNNVSAIAENPELTEEEQHKELWKVLKKALKGDAANKDNEAFIDALRIKKAKK